MRAAVRYNKMPQQQACYSNSEKKHKQQQPRQNCKNWKLERFYDANLQPRNDTVIIPAIKSSTIKHSANDDRADGRTNERSVGRNDSWRECKQAANDQRHKPHRAEPTMQRTQEQLSDQQSTINHQPSTIIISNVINVNWNYARHAAAAATAAASCANDRSCNNRAIEFANCCMAIVNRKSGSCPSIDIWL